MISIIARCSLLHSCFDTSLKDFHLVTSWLMEIDRTFSILEEILHSEHIWYVRNRNYDVAVGERIVAYNCIVLVNQIRQRSKREIMDLVV